MEKKTYIKKWRDSIQEKVWEREVFIAMKKAEEKPVQADIDALEFNNKKDISLITWMDENELKD